MSDLKREVWVLEQDGIPLEAMMARFPRTYFTKEECDNRLRCTNERSVRYVPAEPEQAGKAQGWIPVEERLPAWRERVLLLTSDTKNPHRVGYWDDRDDAEEEPTQDPFWCDDQSWFGDHHDGLVTHWMPLPAPPTKDPTND